MSTTVRGMTAADLPAVHAVEAVAGERFRSVTDPRIAGCADDPPFGAAELRDYIDAGHAWVATEDDEVVGFVVIDLLDDCAHIEEVAVAPDAGRRGYGRALVETVVTWAGRHGCAAVTLTTFRDVAWNGPWYQRLGFRDIAESDLTDGLRARRESEAAEGLAPELRTVMRREVPSRSG